MLFVKKLLHFLFSLYRPSDLLYFSAAKSNRKPESKTVCVMKARISSPGHRIGKEGKTMDPGGGRTKEQI